MLWCCGVREKLGLGWCRELMMARLTQKNDVEKKFTRAAAAEANKQK
jgi:hypothetical protein